MTIISILKMPTKKCHKNNQKLDKIIDTAKFEKKNERKCVY